VSEQIPSTDVVVIGAGLAGLTAAYELRDRDVIVFDRRDRVGGRTLSWTHHDHWYNSGAQFVWDKRTLDLCRQLGVELLDAKGAKASLYLRGKLSAGASPYTMFLKLPLSLRERYDLGMTITRLRRLAHRMDKLDPAQIDSGSLADLMGDVTPVTRAVMDLVSESGTGLDASEVSGWIGLGYAIHLFGGDVNDTLKQVVGGTQTITKTLAKEVGTDRVRLGSEVVSVEPNADGVRVRYRADGREQEIQARTGVMAATADTVLATLDDLPAEKRAALERMVPYGRIISIARLTHETKAMPWDELLVTPVIGDLSFEQISNNSFFLKQADKPRRRPGSCLITLSTGARADQLWDLDDDAASEVQLDELSRIFPHAAQVLAEGETRIERWTGFPQFRKGWLAGQSALREPVGRLHFCGDYTAQPGTPGAVGSGYHSAQAVKRALDAAPPASSDGRRPRAGAGARQRGATRGS
jgi:protoporphyrinogen/coproporphyrinogen III oxidase